MVSALQVTVHFNTGIEDAFGANVLEGLHLVDNATGEKRDLKVNGLFYGIGHQPNSKLVAGQIDLDAAGYVKVRQHTEVTLLLPALGMYRMRCVHMWFGNCMSCGRLRVKRRV
jgi:thioredoxin reductase